MFGKLKQDENDKNNNLQDNIWQTIAGQLGYLCCCCFIFSDKGLAFVKLPRSPLRRRGAPKSLGQFFFVNEFSQVSVANLCLWLMCVMPHVS